MISLYSHLNKYTRRRPRILVLSMSWISIIYSHPLDLVWVLFKYVLPLQLFLYMYLSLTIVRFITPDTVPV